MRFCAEKPYFKPFFSGLNKLLREVIEGLPSIKSIKNFERQYKVILSSVQALNSGSRLGLRAETDPAQAGFVSVYAKK